MVDTHFIRTHRQRLRVESAFRVRICCAFLVCGHISYDDGGSWITAPLLSFSVPSKAAATLEACAARLAWCMKKIITAPINITIVREE